MRVAEIIIERCYNCPFRVGQICGKLGREIVYPMYYESCDKNFPKFCPLKEIEENESN